MKWLDLKEGMELTKRRGTKIVRTKIKKVSPNKDDQRVIFEIEEDLEEETFEKRLNEYVFEDTQSDSLFSNSEEDKKKLKEELIKQKAYELKDFKRMKNKLRQQFNIVVQAHISLKLKLERF